MRFLTNPSLPQSRRLVQGFLAALELALLPLLLAPGAGRGANYYYGASLTLGTTQTPGYQGNGLWSGGKTGGAVLTLLSYDSGQFGSHWVNGAAQSVYLGSKKTPAPSIEFFFPAESELRVTLPLLAQAEAGTEGLPVLVVDPAQAEWPEVLVESRVGTAEARSFSTLAGFRTPTMTVNAAGPWQVAVRWFWNDQEILSITDWAKNGSNGKWGTYRAEVWDLERHWYLKDGTGGTYHVGTGTGVPNPDYSAMTLVKDGWYRQDHQRLRASLTFEVQIRGQEPLPAGTPPAFTTQPTQREIIRKMGDAEFEISTAAHAGAPFAYRWVLEGVGVPDGRAELPTTGPVLKLASADLTETGQTYSCEVWNADGMAISEKVFVRLPRRPLLDMKVVPDYFHVGEEATLRPGVQSETPCTFAWSGPALTGSGQDRVHIGTDGALHIREARLEDGGYYRVTVTNAEAATVREISVMMVSLPPPVTPLRTGLVLRGHWGGSTWNTSSYWHVPNFAAQGRRVPSHTAYSISYNRIEFNRTTPDLAGDYSFNIAYSTSRTKDEILSNGRYGTADKSGYLTLSRVTSVIVPDERAQLPDFTLPPGRVRVAYDYEPPLPVNLAAAGTRFTCSGLPRGLKMNATSGRISGIPEQGGEFQVKMVAGNAKGTSATRTLPLQIDGLSGAVGAFVLCGTTPSGGGLRFDLTVTASGTYTLKGLSKPVTGLLEVDAAGQVRLVNGLYGVELHFDRALNRVTGRYATDVVRGWRQTWSRLHPATAYEGRYHFNTAASAPPAGLTSVAQGTEHGACVVSATGGTVVTYFQDNGAPSVTTAFLSPDGEAWLMPRQPYGYGAAVLEINAGARTISGTVALAWAAVYGPKEPVTELYPAFAHYHQGGWWPSGLGMVAAHVAEPVKHTFAGRRYVAPKAGQMLGGFDAGSSNIKFVMGVAGVTGTVSFFATLAENDALTLPKPSKDTWHASARLNRTTGELTGTVRLTVPTGTKPDGTVVWKTLALPYHAYFIPLSGGGLAEHRIAGFARTPLWLSTQASNRFLWPLSSVPVRMIPSAVAAPPYFSGGGVSSPVISGPPSYPGFPGFSPPDIWTPDLGPPP